MKSQALRKFAKDYQQIWAYFFGNDFCDPELAIILQRMKSCEPGAEESFLSYLKPSWDGKISVTKECGDRVEKRNQAIQTILET